MILSRIVTTKPPQDRYLFTKRLIGQLLSFQALREVELEQPIFGANYIKGKVIAQPNGNWEGEAKFKLHFKSGGAIDFGTAMLKAAQMGIGFISDVYKIVVLGCPSLVLDGFDRHFQASVHLTISCTVIKSQEYKKIQTCCK